MKTAQKILEKYKEFLIKSGVSPSTTERKLSSVRVYLNFLEAKNYLILDKKPEIASTAKDFKPEEIINKLSSLGILGKESPRSTARRLLAKLNSLRYTLPYAIKYGQPKWLIKYHKLSYSRFINLALLIIFCVGLGVGVYDQFGRRTSKEGRILGTAPVSVPAFLSFQGRLTDQYDTPIGIGKTFAFSIYNVGTGGTALWSETKNITPDIDGIFNTLLGDTVDIDRSIFKDNMDLYLGVTVGGDPEMTARQQIATVGYAFNSQYLQGYGVGATGIGAQINEIPIIDGNGFLGIAASNPTLQTTGGTFTIQSPVLVLTTTGDGDISLSLDGTGGVGIGTTNPLELLHVSKLQDATTKIQVSNLNAGIDASAGIKLSSHGGDSLIYRTSDVYSVGQLANNLVIHEASGNIVFWGATEIARFSNGGNLGIGTTTPSQKLDIDGSINVGNTGIFGSLAVSSTGLVTNLNADMLDGLHASSFVGIGDTAGFTTGSGVTNFVSKWSSS